MKKALLLSVMGGLLAGAALFAPDAGSQGVLALLSLPFLVRSVAVAGDRAGEVLAPVALLVSAAAGAVYQLPLPLVGFQLAAAFLAGVGLAVRREGEEVLPPQKKLK